MVAMATSLRTSKSAMSSSDNLTPASNPDSNSVSLYEGYSPTKAKIGCHGNVPQHLWSPI